MKTSVSSDAVREFERVIKAYVWTGGKDPAMLKMYAADRKDMRKVLSLYIQGKWTEAGDVARRMDTSPREYIPETIWNHITLP